MKKKFAGVSRGLTGSLVLLVSLVSLNACGDSGDKPSQYGAALAEEAKSGEILPFYVVFKADGSADIRGISIDGAGARVVDVKEEEFPIAAKIKKVETLTFVTYEGSCEVLTPTLTGYKKIIIQNDALCAKIKP